MAPSAAEPGGLIIVGTAVLPRPAYLNGLAWPAHEGQLVGAQPFSRAGAIGPDKGQAARERAVSRYDVRRHVETEIPVGRGHRHVALAESRGVADLRRLLSVLCRIACPAPLQ